LFELVLRIGFSLLVVFGLMWGLAKLARRPLGGRHGTGSLSVLHRQQLSRGSSVAVVQVAGRALVLGVTDQQVSLLGETELEAFEKHPHPAKRRHTELVPDDVLPADVLPAGVLPVESHGRLAGSALSPRTWRSTLDFIRDRTTRQ
jgi:flagellar protein FliO/FliZ